MEVVTGVADRKASVEQNGTAAIVGMFGVIGSVIVVTALLSGLLEKSRLPQILVFLAMGVLLGPLGLGVVDLSLTSATVQIIATLGLVLVLFTDAVSVRLPELKRQARLAAIILGPGTLLTAVVNTAAAYWLLDIGLAGSAILGAALASTDPVLLRGLLRNPGTPQAARNALRIESGMNDAVLVPVVLIAMATVGAGAAGGATWAETAVRVFLLGAGAGVAVGFVAVGALDFVRKRVGIRRDYESLYALGVALAGFAIAEAFHGSGFIAAFAAGITVAALDVELCDCFYDYGEATAEMALIFTFVALGSSAIWSGLEVANGPTLLFALVALFSRGLILIPTLAWTSLDRRSRLFTIWFGPRGLSSLLLVLLPVFAGMPGSERLFAITALVVLLSIVVHGGSQMLLRPRRVAAAGPAEPGAITDITGAPVTGPAVTEDAAFETTTDATIVATTSSPPESHTLESRTSLPEAAPVPGDAERITMEEMDELVRRGERVVLLDVRTDTAYESESMRAARAIRASPDDAVRVVRVLGQPPDTWLASYCA